MKIANYALAAVGIFKNQPTALLLAYVFLGILGLVLSFVVDANYLLNLFIVFASGAILGFSSEKLLKKKIRKISLNLISTRQE